MEAPPPVKVTLEVDGKRHTMNVDHDTSFVDFKTRAQAQIPTTASHDDALAFYTEHGGQISKVNSTCFNWIMRGEMAADLLCSANGKPPPATKPFNIDAPPHVNAMIRSAGDDLNHIVEAIPELFDNSIAATMNVELGGTRHVWFCVDSDGGHAAVFDNGAGMDAQELEGLLRMFHSQEAKGNITPKMTADGEHACPQTFVSPYISKYGVGLKQAGFWIADHIAVRTRKATEQQRRVLEVQMSEEELKRKEKTVGENPYRFEATTHAEGVPRGECATEFHRAVLEMEKDHPHFTCIVLRVRPHNKDQLSTKAARDHVCSRLADTYAMHLHHTTFESVFKCSKHASCTHAEHQRAPLDLRVRVYDGARLGSDHLLKLNANGSGGAGGGGGGSGGAVSSATEDDEAAGEVGGSAAAHRPGAACVTSPIQSAWDLGWNNDPFIFKVVFDVKGKRALTTCCHGAVLYFPYRNSAETYPGTDVQEAKDRVSCFWQGRWAPKSSLSRLPEPMLKLITKGNRKIAVDWQSRIHTFLFFNDDTPVTLNKLRLDDAVERAVQEPRSDNVKRPDRKDPDFRLWLEAQHRNDEDVQYIEAFGANTIERGPWSHVRVGSTAFKAGDCVMLAHSKGKKPHNNPDGPLPARIVRFETAIISGNRLPVVVATCFTGRESDGTAAGEEISLQVDRHLKTPVLTPQELQEALAIVLQAVATEIKVVCKGTRGTTTWSFKGLTEFLSAGIPAGTALPGMSVTVLDGKGEIIKDLGSKKISVRRTLNGRDEHHNKDPHRSAKFEFVTTNMRKAMQHTLRFEVLVGANIAVWREFPFTVRAATPHSAIPTVSPAGVKYLAGETQLSVAVRVQDAYQNDIPDCDAESSARILVRGQGQQLSLVPLSGAATEGWVRSECQDSGLELGPWTIDGKVGSGESEVDIQLCFRLGGCELECTARDITVVPGPPASAELHLSPTSVEFGESSEASVTALDKFGAVTKAQGWSVQLLVGEGRDQQLLVDDEQAITEPFEVLTGPQECIDGCGEYALRARLNGTGRQAPVMTECCDLEVTPSTAVASLQLFARDTAGREVEIGTATNGSLTIEQGSFDRIGLRFLNSEGIAANVDKSWFKGSGRNRGCVKVQKGGSGAYKSEEHDVEESSSVVLRGLKDDTHVYKIKCDFRNPWPLDPDSTEIELKITADVGSVQIWHQPLGSAERHAVRVGDPLVAGEIGSLSLRLFNQYLAPVPFERRWVSSQQNCIKFKKGSGGWNAIATTRLTEDRLDLVLCPNAAANFRVWEKEHGTFRFKCVMDALQDHDLDEAVVCVVADKRASSCYLGTLPRRGAKYPEPRDGAVVLFEQHELRAMRIAFYDAQHSRVDAQATWSAAVDSGADACTSIAARSLAIVPGKLQRFSDFASRPTETHTLHCTADQAQGIRLELQFRVLPSFDIVLVHNGLEVADGAEVEEHAVGDIKIRFKARQGCDFATIPITDLGIVTTYQQINRRGTNVVGGCSIHGENEINISAPDDGWALGTYVFECKLPDGHDLGSRELSIRPESAHPIPVRLLQRMYEHLGGDEDLHADPARMVAEIETKLDQRTGGNKRPSETGAGGSSKRSRR